MVAKRSVSRRLLLGAGLVLPLGACSRTQMSNFSDRFASLFSSQKAATVLPRGERMARWVQNEGRDAMMAPEGLAPMGIVNHGRDVPAKLMGQDGSDGRYVVVLITMRGVKEFIFHRKQNDVLMMHHCDLHFTRLTTVRYPHYGKISVVTDQALADADFQQQLAYWFDRMPGR